MKHLPDKLYSFENQGQKYLFSGNNGILFNHSEKVDYFLEYPHEVSDEKLKETLFGTDYEPDTIFCHDEADIDLDRLCIFVTNDCNLDCHYCYVTMNRAAGNKMMDSSEFKKSIHFFLDRFKTSKPISIIFFGGEPVLNKRMIKEGVSFLNEISEKRGIQFKYSISTNGTLIDQNILDLLVENNFRVMVSIDGPREIHDRYRVFKDGSGTFNAVLDNLMTISGYLPTTARITVSRFPIDLVRIYKTLREAGVSNILIQPAATSDLPSNIDLSNISTSLSSLGKYFLAEISHNKIVNIHNLIKQLKTIHTGLHSNIKHYPCYSGYSGFSVDVDGTIYLCHRFHNIDDFCLGHINKTLDSEKRKALLENHISKKRTYECAKCWAEKLCGGSCYHSAFVENGKSNSVSRTQCHFEKEMIKCALNIYTSMLPEQRVFLENLTGNPQWN